MNKTIYLVNRSMQHTLKHAAWIYLVNRSMQHTLKHAAWMISIILMFLFLPEAKAETPDTQTTPSDTLSVTGAVIGGNIIDGTDVYIIVDAFSGNPTYVVNTAKGLAWIAWVTNYQLTSSDPNNNNNFYPANAGFKNCLVFLNDNISLKKPDNSSDSYEWIPIGRDQNKDKSFQGTFEGNGKTVSGLNITTIPTMTNLAGLFGSIESATVKNLRVEGKIAIGSISSSFATFYIGGIAGYINSSQLINCSNAVKITGNATVTNYRAMTGGIVGRVANSLVSNCWNEAAISFTPTGIGAEVGGIAGRLTTGTITNCYSTGAIEGSGTDGLIDISCGGIVGALDNSNGDKTLSNCYATGVVSVTSVAAANTAPASNASVNNANAGGIAGSMASSVNYTSTIENCLALNVPQYQTASIPADAGVSSTAAAGTVASIGRIVGKKNDAKGTNVLSDNYASTLITLLAETTAGDNIPVPVNSTTPATPTDNIGADQINGADLYLDGAATAIASWAGDNDNTKAFTTIGTADNGLLPKLKKATEFDTDGLPTTFGEEFNWQQPDLVSANYLKELDPLTLPNDASTITISYADGVWSYKDDDADAVGFNGTIKLPDNTYSSTDKLVINDVTGNPTLMFNGNVQLKPTDGTALTINTGCELTLQGRLLIDIAEPTDGQTYYCINNSGTLAVAPTNMQTSIHLQCYGTAINNTGTLNNAWIEWQFASALGENGAIEITSNNKTVSRSPQKNKTFAMPVIVGDTYKLTSKKDGSSNFIGQQGKAKDGNTYVIYYPAPAGNGVAVFTDVKEAVSVTVTQPTGGGGSISVFCNDSLLAENDYVPNGATLACRYNALPGYKLDTYKVTSDTNSSTSTDVSNFSTYQVPNGATSIAITATFEENPNAEVKEEVVKDSNPTSAITVPTVVIPTNDRPTVDGSSTIKLITGDLEEAQQDEVKEALKDIAHNELIYAEIALVEEKDGGIKIPIQPKPECSVTVIYPYPSGTTSSDIFTIVHLKTDGTTETYSVAKGNLTNATAGLTFQVSSFSPFGIAWTKNSTTDPDDPGTTPDPDPAPTVYYTVVIPALEGATTDPVAGTYEVEAWDSFRFYLTLDADYDQSTPVVTTDRGETIEPRSSDGAYVIRYVRTPVEISIAGIQKNADVANATILSGTRVWTEPSAVCLETDRTEEVRIVSLAGTTVAAFTAQPGTTRQALAPGAYVVKMGRAVYKVIVR